MNDILLIIILFCLGQIHSALEGIREGYYYHSAVKSGDSIEYNIHVLFLVQRIIIVTTISFAFDSYLMALIYISSSILCFSFIHNGAYYSTRNNLDVDIYKDRFKSDSISSTAKMEFTYKQRFLQYMSGLVLLSAGIVIYLLMK